MHYFISDAHIRTDESYRAKLLIKFLHDVRLKMTNLYILGDLFEFWFEYNLVFPKYYFKTLATFYNLIQEGKKIHFILGNHEVMIGNFLRNFGFSVHAERAIVNIHGRKVYVSHGDKIDKRLWITLWEKLLTSKLNRTLYSILHPDIGIFLAQGICFLSRKQRNNPNLVNLLENYAVSKLHEVDTVILAHSHVPVYKRFPHNKYYLNTGDWIKHFSYVVIDKDKTSLHYYRP